MSTYVSEWVASVSTDGPSVPMVRLVAYALATAADDAGVVGVTQEDIVALTASSVRTVRDSLAMLDRLEFINRPSRGVIMLTIPTPEPAAPAGYEPEAIEATKATEATKPAAPAGSPNLPKLPKLPNRQLLPVESEATEAIEATEATKPAAPAGSSPAPRVRATLSERSPTTTPKGVAAGEGGVGGGGEPLGAPASASPPPPPPSPPVVDQVELAEPTEFEPTPTASTTSEGQAVTRYAQIAELKNEESFLLELSRFHRLEIGPGQIAQIMTDCARVLRTEEERRDYYRHRFSEFEGSGYQKRGVVRFIVEDVNGWAKARKEGQKPTAKPQERPAHHRKLDPNIPDHARLLDIARGRTTEDPGEVEP